MSKIEWTDIRRNPNRSCGDQVVTTRKARVTSGGER